MKKKLWISVLLLITAMFAALSLVACKKPNTEKTVYGLLNKLIAAEKNSVTLDLSLTQSGETLTGKYVAKNEANGMKVTYTFERLNPIEKNEDGTYTFPTEVKSSHSGSMVLRDGKVVEQDGETADITIESITASGVKFEEGSFKNVKTENGKFTAEVSSPAAFLQQELSCEGMKVEVSYTESAITSLKITYTAAGADVSMAYTFA